MGLKSMLVRPFSKYISVQVEKLARNAVADQEMIRKKLLSKGADTQYGRDHHLNPQLTYKEWQKRVPIIGYEDMRSYIDLIHAGEVDVLWPGRPKYFAKTSGTTSGVKYIPLTQDSMPNHIGSARNALMNYVSLSGNAHLFDGKMIFLSGSPILDETKMIPTGRLSGIVNLEIPAWVKGNQLPSFQTNCIEDWEEKLEAIIAETTDHDMRLISGIPPWVQMYYERLLSKTGRDTILEIFPNLSLFMYGGVNFEPYRAALEELVGARIDSVELYPASEGFIAFQDKVISEGLLLNTNSGIFYEFIPLSELESEAPRRLSLLDVEIDVDYALIINNNAGLWGYNIGDMVRFVSLDPYRLIVSGRVKHFISAFGEHVIGKEVEESMLIVGEKHGFRVVEFTVAPMVNPPSGETPYHEWLVEFDVVPEDMGQIELEVDNEMRKQNIYYDDLIRGKILQPLKFKILRRDTFRDYMKSKGKLGGQNKVPRLSNDRKIAEALISTHHTTVSR